MIDVETLYSDYFDKMSFGQVAILSPDNFEKYIKSAKIFLESILAEDAPKSCEDDIKCCLYVLAEEIFEEEKRGGVKSENIDGYSVTFKDQSPAGRRLLKTALIYLGKSGLLYAGVD
ncbi:MAG: hypothetical protein IJE62_00410 [Clostridia bacterium]|nr:hypothetical protein [Clostridia bacterium]